MMSSLVQIAAIVLVCMALLMGLYWRWQVFSLYRSLNQLRDTGSVTTSSHLSFRARILLSSLEDRCLGMACRLTCWRRSARFGSNCDTLSSVRPSAELLSLH